MQNYCTSLLSSMSGRIRVQAADLLFIWAVVRYTIYSAALACLVS